MENDNQLLRSYAENGSDEAFRRIVEKYSGLVYCAALRKLNGDAQAAQDVAQMVFTNLARKSKSLSNNVVLAGWLYRDVCHKSAGVVRAEGRRRKREQTAAEMTMNTPDSSEAFWHEIALVLEDAMERLSRIDRDALVLRFFQNASIRAVAEGLRLTEAAAEKRISRALERLRLQISRRGITCSAAVLGASLRVHAVAAVPDGLAGSFTSVAVATAVVPTVSPFLHALTFMNKTTSIIATALVLSASVAIVVQYEQNIHLREKVHSAELMIAGQIQRESQVRQELEAKSPVTSAITASVTPPKAPPMQELMRRAVALTHSANGPEGPGKEIEALLSQIAVKDLKDAADLARGIPDRNWRIGFLNMLLDRWATTDGRGAVAYVVKNAHGEEQLQLLPNVVQAWAAQDSEAAWDWFRNDAPQQITFDARGNQNGLIIETLFQAMGQADFDGSLKRALELQGNDSVSAFGALAEAAQNSDQEIRLLGEVQKLSGSDIKYAAQRAVLGAWTVARPNEARAYVENMNDPTQKSALAEGVGPFLMATDPAAGANWWLQQVPGNNRGPTLESIIVAWSTIDLAGAAEWLGTLGNAPDLDAAKQAFATAAMSRAPASAMAWANSIQKTQSRLSTMRSVYRTWRGQDAGAANAWLVSAGLSPDIASTITAQ